MGTENNNPFIMPGFGQAGASTQNPLMASMEMMQRAWQGMAGAGGMDAAAMASPMSIEDMDKRITDLRAVESWLRLNLSMLAGTIQGLEVQRSTIATLMSFAAKSGVASSPGAAGASTSTAQSPLDAVLGNWPASFMGSAAAPEAAAAPATNEAADAAPASASQAAETAASYATSAETAVKGWWDLLQTQFDTLASAAAASMQNADADTSSSDNTDAKPSSKPTAKKTAAKKPTAKKAPVTKTPATKATTTKATTTKAATTKAAATKASAKAAAKPAPKAAARTATATKAAVKSAAKSRTSGKA